MELDAARVRQAIDEYRQSAPVGTPPGVNETLTQIEQSLDIIAPPMLTPGQRAVQEASGGG